jgi:5-methylcytosine-specific restriction enzyme subunit McrC
MTARIELREYATSTMALEAGDVVELRRDLGKHITLTPSLEPGLYDLNPGSFVGVVRLASGLTLDLLPKVPLYNVMWMIAEVERLEADVLHPLHRPVRINTFDDILEPIARSFVEQVEHLIDRGLYRTYIEVEENLTAIRGRIDFPQDLSRNVVLRHRTYCRFTEFSWDVPENQVIRQVVRKLARWGFSSRLTGRLLALDRQMEDVRLMNFGPQDVDRFHYSRQSEHYRPLHRFCQLFLNGFSLSEQVGDSPFDGFVMDMNLLFERFIALMLEQEFSGGWQLDRQESFDLFRGHAMKIRPDLLLTHHGLRAMVGDTKYKRRKGIDGGDDYYQMIAYCIVLGLGNAMLIYPRHLVDIDQRLTVWGSDIRIHETSIDLRESREAIRAGIATLAEQMMHAASTGLPV